MSNPFPDRNPYLDRWSAVQFRFLCAIDEEIRRQLPPDFFMPVFCLDRGVQ